ncbi:centromere protein T-like [Elysia marginata]|uniref:Centromere protein T-like n=1 Tax=Elysia marginata TaxID=1093978 RepID=A0AAV4FIY1_9GAST|nr:centromere protein T-like [Elysia marginata]
MLSSLQKQPPSQSRFSSLATPHIDLRKRVMLSSLQKQPPSHSRSKVEKIQQQVPKMIKPKKATNRAKKAAVSNLPKRTVKYFAELHSDMKLSKDAIDEIEKVSEQFWVDTFKALEAYALHAGRKTVQDSDVILLMKTQRLISGTEDLHNKIRQMMPMELRKELIPCAYPTPQNK